jgi:hypothetical protein
MLKNYEEKSRMYIWTFYVHSQNFVKKKHFVWPAKKDKNMTRKELF